MSLYNSESACRKFEEELSGTDGASARGCRDPPLEAPVPAAVTAARTDPESLRSSNRPKIIFPAGV